MNSITLIGRFTRDPELKYGQSGKAYARFSIAVNRPFTRDEADFINCVAFGKTAETIGEYFRKGSQIGLTGRLQMNRYETQNGEKRTSYDVVVDNFDFLGSRNTNNSGNNYNNNSYGNNNSGYSRNNGPMMNNEEPNFYGNREEPEFKPKKPVAVDTDNMMDDEDEFPF